MSTEDAGPVALWWTPLRVDSSALTALAAVLHPAERARADRFLTPELRARFIVGRGRLREILGRQLSCHPATIVIEDGDGRVKPSAPGTGLEFNLAHSHGIALYATSRVARLGVDLEAISARAPSAKLMRRYGTGAELARFNRLPEADRQRAFFDCWVRKEAYAKGTGAGLTESLATAEVWAGAGVPVGLDDWSIHHVAAPAGFAAALAISGAELISAPAPIRFPSGHHP